MTTERELVLEQDPDNSLVIIRLNYHYNEVYSSLVEDFEQLG